MNADLNGDVPAGLAGAEKFQPLLHELVVRVRRFRETPLQEDLDSQGIAQASLHSFLSGIPEQERGPFRNWETTRTALDSLVLGVLLGDRPSAIGHRPSAIGQKDCDSTDSRQPTADSRQPTADGSGSGKPPALAAWLDRFHQTLGEVHPKAFDLLGLRLEGCSNRDLAQRFGMGLRLVQRILGDLRLAWEKTLRKE